MLFAAGFGKRMGALTRDLPKPMLPLAGRPLIDHALEMTQEFGGDPIVANLHYLPDPLKAHLAPRGVRLSHETDEPLETGGGLRAALPLLGPEPVLTVNTDVVWRGPNPLAMLEAAWDPQTMSALLMCLPPERAHAQQGKGDFSRDTAGRLQRCGPLIYGGVQLLRTDALRDIEAEVFSLNLLWDRYIEEGRLFGIEYPGHWCDAGHPNGLREAEALLAATDV
jgi:MurNAc alpha-1-phosphate uridylyltransferase